MSGTPGVGGSGGSEGPVDGDALRGRVQFVGVAAALVAATVLAMLGESGTVVVTLFWLLGPTATVLTTALVLRWAVENGRDSAFLTHVAAWAAAGTVVLGVSGGLTVYVLSLHGDVRTVHALPVYEWACGGYVVGAVVGVHSADRRAGERELRRERRRAENLAQTLSVLNRVLRHDIRNDVNVVEGYVDLIAEDVEAGDDRIAVVREHTGRIVELAEYARETERLVTEGNAGVRRLDVVARLERVCRNVESAYPGATIATEFPDSAAVRAHRLVDSAFENLIENAVEHGSTGDRPKDDDTVEHGSTNRRPQADDAVERGPAISRSQAREDAVERGSLGSRSQAHGSANHHRPDDDSAVRVSVERDGDWIAVVVSDRGPGIPDDEVAVLESGTESALEHSDGMGLWLVNWIVTYSGGEVEFAENEPTGSRITVRLPAAGEG